MSKPKADPERQLTKRALSKLLLLLGRIEENFAGTVESIESIPNAVKENVTQEDAESLFKWEVKPEEYEMFQKIMKALGEDTISTEKDIKDAVDSILNEVSTVNARIEENQESIKNLRLETRAMITTLKGIVD